MVKIDESIFSNFECCIYLSVSCLSYVLSNIIIESESFWIAEQSENSWKMKTKMNVYFRITV